MAGAGRHGWVKAASPRRAKADEGVWLPEILTQSTAAKPTEADRADLDLVIDDNHHPVFIPPQLPEALKPDQSIRLYDRLRFNFTNLVEGSYGKFGAALDREREMGSLFNFVPVMLALGIITYYAASAEPQRAVLIASTILSAMGVLKMQGRGFAWHALVAVCLVLCGMMLAQWQVSRSAMPVPLSGITGTVSGTVVAVDQNRKGSPRYLIAPREIEGLATDEIPRYVRLSARSGPDLTVGDGIEGLARLAPLNGPAYPGGYDFAFASRMDGLGMSGFFMGAPGRTDDTAVEEAGIWGSLQAAGQSARQAIGDRIRAGLPGEPGDIVVALVTGDRSGLSDDTQESLRKSGLAHILAISGLHMALVTLTIIWLVRAGLVLVPGFADRHPVRKYAAMAGFVTATAYLMISGQGIATVRAWLMISVMLAASLLDRRAITMRSVAIAAFIILAIYPASLFNPGFQMSFAAVAALVAVYGEWSRFRHRRVSDRRFKERSPLVAGTRNLAGWFGGLSTTSLVAGTATALFALWHFHRVAPMGLIANLLAMPIVSVAVMPLALLTMFLMPYGIEALALRPLGMAVEAVLAVSDHVNSYGYDFETGLKPLSVLAGATLFLVLSCCLRTRLRWFALLPLALLASGLDRRAELPDLLIAQDGRSIAVRTALLPGGNGEAIDGKDSLALLYPGRGRFITDIWQRAYLPNRAFSDHPVQQSCDKDGCAFSLFSDAREYRVRIVYDPEQIMEACRQADMLLAPRLWWVRCRNEHQPMLILKRGDFEARGAHLLKVAADGISVNTAWKKPVSAFELAEGAEEKGMRPPRPWLKRFDNISRRFD